MSCATLNTSEGTIQYIETKHPEVKEYKYWEQLYELLTDMENVMSDASLLNSLIRLIRLRLT
jgi:hypothetical protein